MAKPVGAGDEGAAGEIALAVGKPHRHLALLHIQNAAVVAEGAHFVGAQAHVAKGQGDADAGCGRVGRFICRPIRARGIARLNERVRHHPLRAAEIPRLQLLSLQGKGGGNVGHRRRQGAPPKLRVGNAHDLLPGAAVHLRAEGTVAQRERLAPHISVPPRGGAEDQFVSHDEDLSAVICRARFFGRRLDVIIATASKKVKTAAYFA